MKKLIYNLIILIFLLIASSTNAQTKETVFFEDFEVGWVSWWADNGVWDVGTPAFGSVTPHAGQTCVGTVLNDNYPNYADTRLVSPQINLPNVTGDEKIQLKFWHWFDIENENDQGVVQISVNSGNWQTISNPEFDGMSMLWTQYIADLSPFAGTSVRIAFYFTSDFYWNYTGWYIDDILIEIGETSFPNPEEFELDIGDWYADNGLWQIGPPTFGPDNTHSGMGCAGLVLDGNYTNYANTRLISPELTIYPVPGQTPWLFFYQWFIIENNNDFGSVQLSVNGGSWQTVSNLFSGTNEIWSQFGINLSDYINSTIRIAFYFTSDFYWNFAGWYIDDVRIEGIIGVDINEHKIEAPDISPNPFINKTTIKFNNPNHLKYKLSVFSIAGNKVFERDHITTDKFEFEKCDLKPGVYLFELNGNQVFRTKVIIN